MQGPSGFPTASFWSGQLEKFPPTKRSQKVKKSHPNSDITKLDYELVVGVVISHFHTQPVLDSDAASCWRILIPR